MEAQRIQELFQPRFMMCARVGRAVLRSIPGQPCRMKVPEKR